MERLQPSTNLPKDFYHLNQWIFDNNEAIFTKLQQLYEIYDKLNLGLFIYDLDKMTYQWTNDNFLALMGLNDINELINTSNMSANFYHPDDLKVFHDRNKFFREGKGANYNYLVRIKEGKNRWKWFYHACTSYQMDKNSRSASILGIVIEFSSNIILIEQIGKIIKQHNRQKNKALTSKLSPREIEITQLLAKGINSPLIADMLNISEHTVRNHRKNILKKLDLHGVAALVSFAIEHGFD